MPASPLLSRARPGAQTTTTRVAELYFPLYSFDVDYPDYYKLYEQVPVDASTVIRGDQQVL